MLDSEIRKLLIEIIGASLNEAMSPLERLVYCESYARRALDLLNNARNHARVAVRDLPEGDIVFAGGD